MADSPAPVSSLPRTHQGWFTKQSIRRILLDPSSVADLPISHTLIQRPPGSTLLLYDSRSVLSWKADGYAWKEPAGVTITIRDNQRDVLKCTYTRLLADDTFQRRAYVLVLSEDERKALPADSPSEHLVLVHYMANAVSSHVPHIEAVSPAVGPCGGGTDVIVVLSRAFRASRGAPVAVNCGGVTLPTTVVTPTVLRVVTPQSSGPGQASLFVTCERQRTPAVAFTYSAGGDGSEGGSGRNGELASSVELTQSMLDLVERVSPIHTFTVDHMRRCLLQPLGESLLESLLLDALQSAFITSEHVQLVDNDTTRRTLLHCASGLGFTAIVSFLMQLQPEPDINCRDARGRTPLHWAALAGDGHMVSALLSFGASESVVDNSGATPDSLAPVAVAAVAMDGDDDDADYYGGMDGDVDDEEEKREGDGDGDGGGGGGEGEGTGDDDEKRQDNDGMSAAFANLTLEDMGISTEELEDPTVSDAAFQASVVKIQHKIRWWLYRRKNAARKLQAMARGMLQRRSFKRMRESVTLIQSWVKSNRARKKYRRLREVTVHVQRSFRRSRRGDDEDDEEEDEEEEEDLGDGEPLLLPDGNDHDDDLDGGESGHGKRDQQAMQVELPPELPPPPPPNAYQ